MKIQLSISLLASNRAASLERCLDSLRPLLMQVPSELIVVFTGTDERVREIASRYTEKILPFTWCDNFSAARNVGLWAAKGEWFMYIDDDEWFEDVTEIRDFFLSGEYRRYGSAFYKQKNYIQWDGIQYSDYDAFRMARIVPGMAFRDRIHEELSPYIAPSKYFNTYVNHYGYIGQSEKGRAEKPLRNIPLLLQNIEDRPSYIKNYVQITQEYIIVNNWEKAEEYCRKGRSLCKGAEDNHYWGWLNTSLLYILCTKKEYENAEQEALLILEQKRPWELIRLYVYEVLLVLYPQQGESEKTLRYGAEFEDTLAYMDEHPDLWREQTYADLTEGSIKIPSKLYLIRISCTEAALKLGDKAQAIRFFKLLPWEDETWMERYYPAFDDWKKDYADLFGELLEHIPESSPYQKLQSAVAWKDGESGEENSTGAKGSGECDSSGKKECLKRLVQCVESTESAYLKQQAVKEAVLMDVDLAEIASAMDPEVWKSCAEKLRDLIPEEKSEKLHASTENLVQDAPVYGLWLKKLLYEKNLIHGYLTGDSMIHTLKEYSVAVLKYYRIQYRDEIFSKEKRILLPKDGRFALYIWEALEKMEHGEFPEAVRSFRSALRFYPPMTGVIREVIRQMSVKAAIPAQNTGAEFQMLARQMKEALRTMIDSGQYTEALSVIMQLSPLLPEDLELLRMRQKVLQETAE